ncbi:3-deoxy-manno-octulosonate cytidylyltransferase [Catenovulum agarivorans DS-2]|uniref:3-deoxy-manno-octulosonate cytidylyltransferase n=1 Tax=Catenovulum agarivorans DS-2 TaxID=1328313 RepID=W7QTA1_9ALTE|nr:3-deoxy-manno-octulosonate cytidylyltransferase [Catenovulum agarivorans]EWH12267.1 3-deoxy-manno-octulosonate cytidylyltransferase [Catenovulum agarivorans DS-2]
MSYIIVIPARYASTRFPGKPLVDMAGKTMLQRVYKQCKKTQASKIVIATDDERILQTAQSFGAECVMTSSEHDSGTARIGEVIQQIGLKDSDVVVNVQGDEPFIPPTIIDQVANNMALYTEADMATLAVPIEDKEELFNPNAVKVVMDKNGYALYFSRATIPYDRSRFVTPDDSNDIVRHYYRHIGIYAYRAEFVRQYLNWDPSPLEDIESLEQLRVLWHGEKIHVGVATETPPAGIDTPEDLARALEYIKNKKKLKDKEKA